MFCPPRPSPNICWRYVHQLRVLRWVFANLHVCTVYPSTLTWCWRTILDFFPMIPPENTSPSIQKTPTGLPGDPTLDRPRILGQVNIPRFCTKSLRGLIFVDLVKLGWIFRVFFEKTGGGLTLMIMNLCQFWRKDISCYLLRYNKSQKKNLDEVRLVKSDLFSQKKAEKTQVMLLWQLVAYLIPGQ